MKHFLFFTCSLLFLGFSGFTQTHTIPQVQSDGLTSPYVGEIVNVVGVVTGVFDSPGELGGFFLQDVNGDANTETSDGIFIQETNGNVSVGDLLNLRGDVEEIDGQTVITNILNIEPAGPSTSVATKSVVLPFASVLDAESVEGMYVVFQQNLETTGNENLGQFGELVLSTGRLNRPTNTVDPNDSPASGTSFTGVSNAGSVNFMAGFNQLDQVVLDDGRDELWPNPIPYIDGSTNSHRVESTVSDVTGCMGYGSGSYRVHPTQTPAFTYAARPSLPSVGGDITVATINLESFWTTVDNGSNGALGADSQGEYDRQLDKIVSAIIDLDADILALNELENNGTGSVSAIVNAVNQATGSFYQPVSEPAFAGSLQERNHIIYKANAVSQTGVTESTGGNVFDVNPIAATFIHSQSQETFSVMACQLSGRDCAGASGVNLDQEDGQDCFNDRRKSQLETILLEVAALQDSVGDDDMLILGDMNAFLQEDPLDMLRANGFFNTINNLFYTSGINAEYGATNQIFANSGMLGQLTSGDVWHVNSDEPKAIGYNADNLTDDLYVPNSYRFSDVDPVMVGVQFIPTSLHKGEMNAIRIAPNPSNGIIQILGAIPVRTEVRTITGSLVYDSEVLLTSGRLDLSFLSEGLYVIHMTTSEGFELTERLVISK